MFKKVAVFVLSALIILSSAPYAFATGDTTAPQVLSVQMNKTAYTVGDTMEITLHLDQQETDLNPKYNNLIEFSYLDGTISKLWIDSFTKESSDTYIFSKVLTKDTCPSGTYKIWRISLEDLSGNHSTTSGDNLPAGSQSEFTFTNNARTDWTGPVLESIDLNQATVNVGENVSACVGVEDPSGFGGCSLVISDPENHYFAIGLQQSPDNLEQLSGVTASPLANCYPSGEYCVSAVFLCDSLGNSSIYTISEGTLPVEMQKKITIVNNNDPIIYDHPVITSMSISPQTVTQGDPVDVTVTLNTKGNPLTNVPMVNSYLVLPNGADCGLLYQKVSDGIYTSHTILPVNLPTGDYYIADFMINQSNESGYGAGYDVQWAEPGHDVNGIFIDENGHYTEKITVNPAFSGTDNVSVLKGTAFDPLAGVTASNETEGDMTSKIEVTAPEGFSTDTVGIYLFKYKIKSSQTDSDNTQHDYYDFRWVGVTEVLPGDTGDGGDPLVVTNDNVEIGADSADATISKDGSAISFTDDVSSPGSYTITAGGSGTATNAPALRSARLTSSNGNGKSKATFVIDHSGPVLSVTPSGVWPGNVNVQVTAKDQYGVSLLKWKFGTCTLDDMRNTGTEFKDSFIANSLGEYTIYAKDVLGNETLKSINVSYVPVSSVKMSSSNIKLTTGCTDTLAATVLPANATYKQVIWSSSNAAVATVDDNGTVHAISPGTATITAKAADGPKTGICTVKVQNPVQVSKVVMNRSSKSLFVGGSITLAAKLYPSNATDKTITWSSGNTAIATVDNSGHVKAVGLGTVYICARAANGKYATCKITVKPVNVVKVKLNKTTLHLAANDGFQLIASITPANATDRTIRWYSSNPSIAIVDSNGNIMAVMKGTVYIYAKASNGKFARCRVIVN